jgi:hypothetical protein
MAGNNTLGEPGGLLELTNGELELTNGERGTFQARLLLARPPERAPSPSDPATLVMGFDDCINTLDEASPR